MRKYCDIMENKICIVGNPDTGKTVMLKCLIALMWQNVDTSKWAVINGKFYSNAPTNPFQPNPKVEYRIVFWYKSPKTGSTKLVAISTKGDKREDIIMNWELFLCRPEAWLTQEWYANNKDKWIVPNLCISPCHLNDSTRNEEEHQHHMVRTTISRFVWQTIEQIPTNKIVCPITVEKLESDGGLYTKKINSMENLRDYMNKAAVFYDFIENYCM